MLKSLDKISDRIDVTVEEGLFGGPTDPLRMLAERLAEKIVAEPGFPLKAVRVAKADLPEEEVEQLEIGFYLQLACGAKEAFQWLERLSARQHDVSGNLPEKDRNLFNHTFNIAVDWER